MEADVWFTYVAASCETPSVAGYFSMLKANKVPHLAMRLF